MTDFLQFLSNKAKVYAPVVDEITNVMQQTGVNNIIDLGSGGGGGLLWLSEALHKNNPKLKITLTDLFPNIQAFEYTKNKSSIIEYETEPIDATNVPSNIQGLRTQFLSFHHFKPDQATKILQNAVDANQAIGIFEIQDRTFQSILVMLLSPISVLLTTPFIKPFDFKRLLLTYVIPVIPLVVLWDGIVSCLRTYSVQELKMLVAKVKNNDLYVWKIEKKKSTSGFVILLIGQPEV